MLSYPGEFVAARRLASVARIFPIFLAVFSLGSLEASGGDLSAGDVGGSSFSPATSPAHKGVARCAAVFRQFDEHNALLRDFDTRFEESDLDNVFVISDPHFHHDNVVGYTGRPYTSSRDMNRDLIRKWNEKVPPNATVYILGDFSTQPTRMQHVLRQLNGRKILVLGNHDQPHPVPMERSGRSVSELPALLQAYRDAGFDEVHLAGRFTLPGVGKVNVSHYPYATGGVDSAGRDFPFKYVDDGLPLLHGHTHNRPGARPRSLDLSVEATDYAPLSLRETRNRLAGLPMDFGLPAGVKASTAEPAPSALAEGSKTVGTGGPVQTPITSLAVYALPAKTRADAVALAKGIIAADDLRLTAQGAVAPVPNGGAPVRGAAELLAEEAKKAAAGHWADQDGAEFQVVDGPLDAGGNPTYFLRAWIPAEHRFKPQWTRRLLSKSGAPRIERLLVGDAAAAEGRLARFQKAEGVARHAAYRGNPQDFDAMVSHFNEKLSKGIVTVTTQNAPDGQPRRITSQTAEFQGTPTGNIRSVYLVKSTTRNVHGKVLESESNLGVAVQFNENVSEEVMEREMLALQARFPTSVITGTVRAYP